MQITLDPDDQVCQHANELALRSGRSPGEIVSSLALAGMTSSPSQTHLHSNPPTLDQDPTAKVKIDALMDALQELP